MPYGILRPAAAVRLMETAHGDLPTHFDAAVELDAADKEQIGAWLQGNAADTGTTRHGGGDSRRL